MSGQKLRSRPGRSTSKPVKLLNRLVEHKLMKKVSYEEYRDAVREKYDGPQGALLSTASFLSGHLAMGDRMFRKRRFDLRGCKRILDVGSGAGQIAKHLLRYADHDASLTCFDLSFEMLRRARGRLKSSVPRHVVADLTRLPFADGSFDTVTCGYVLEHLPDPRPGLIELSRVLVPGGRMLLFATEDSVSGAFTSRFGSAARSIAATSATCAKRPNSIGPASCGSAGCTKCSAPAASALR